MQTKEMQITNLSAAFNAPTPPPPPKKPANAHQTASYMKAMTFRGALPLWPTRLDYKMADNTH